MIIKNKNDNLIDDLKDDLKDDIIYLKLYEKDKDKFIDILSDIIKTNKDNKFLIVINIIIYLINNKDKNNEIEKNMIAFMFDKLFDKFYLEINNEKIIIPIYVLEKINKKFQEMIINELQKKYPIDEDTAFDSVKNKKFLLLEQMIERKFFLFNYEKETIKFIKNTINNAYYNYKYCYEKLIIIFNNYNKNTDGHYFYSIIETIIKRKEFKNEIELLEKLKNQINDVKNTINLLENMLILYGNYKSKSKNK